jgi:hypothetical protein
MRSITPGADIHAVADVNRRSPDIGQVDIILPDLHLTVNDVVDQFLDRVRQSWIVLPPSV